MTSNRLLIERPDLSPALVAAFKEAGTDPVDECVAFMHEAAALLQRGFQFPADRSTVHEPSSSGRGDHNGSYYYDGTFREGDAERYVEIETSYNQPEEMMYPEPHHWSWRYTVRGLSDGRQLELRCSRGALVGNTTSAWIACDVTGSAQKCTEVFAALRARFGKDATSV